jgi:hypothetical protein
MGIISLLLSCFFDWKCILQNIGLAFIVAGITTFLLKYDIYEMLANDGIRNAGIEAIKHGRNAMLEYVGGLEDFLRKAHPRKIDICGIAMYSLFEPNNLYELLINLAKDKYKIRIIFADPESKELKFQEEVEHKENSLKQHIKHIIKVLEKRLKQNQNSKELSNYISIHYSKLLPKAFILRSGTKMIITNYFYHGPHYSPCYLIKDVHDGIYKSYIQYLDEVIKNFSKNIVSN